MNRLLPPTEPQPAVTGDPARRVAYLEALLADPKTHEARHVWARAELKKLTPGPDVSREPNR